MQRKSYRPAWAPVFSVAALGLVLMGMQMPREPRRPMPAPNPSMGMYEGTSLSGSFQDALDDAVASATREAPASGTLRHRVVGITGETGDRGHVLRVSIQVATSGHPFTAKSLPAAGD